MYHDNTAHLYHYHSPTIRHKSDDQTRMYHYSPILWTNLRKHKQHRVCNCVTIFYKYMYITINIQNNFSILHFIWRSSLAHIHKQTINSRWPHFWALNVKSHSMYSINNKLSIPIVIWQRHYSLLHRSYFWKHFLYVQ